MKKLVITKIVLMLLLMSSLTVYAGMIPEELLDNDNALIFFAEVVYYHPDKENPDIEISPVKKVKGDVKTGTKQILYNLNIVGDFKIREGNVYLFAYLDENNPTDIFDVTSYDTSELKLKNIDGTGDMWIRFEQYLNEGRYLDAEHERLDRKNESLPIEGEKLLFTELIGISEDDAESVHIHYNGEVFDIDTKKFYNAVEGIMLTDIEDVSLEQVDGNKVSLPNGMYITVNGFDGYAFVTDDCMVDKYGRHHSNIPVGAYTMKFVDRAKITALFADDYYNLPPLERAEARSLLGIGVIILVFSGILILLFVLKTKRGK